MTNRLGNAERRGSDIRNLEIIVNGRISGKAQAHKEANVEYEEGQNRGGSHSRKFMNSWRLIKKNMTEINFLLPFSLGFTLSDRESQRIRKRKKGV